MKTQHQIFVDKLLVKPFAIGLNLLVRFVGQLLRPDHSLDKDFERILICKIKGLGSILQSTPLIAALRSKYPNAKIIYLSTASNKALLEKIEILDEYVLLDDQSFIKLIFSFAKTWWKILRFRPQVYIDLEIYSNFSTVMTAFSLANNRFGYYLTGSEYRLGIYTHMMFFNVQTPISKIYLQFASLLGIETDEISLIDLSQSLVENNIPLPIDTETPYLIINPNASDLRVERRWPALHFILLIQQVATIYSDLNIYLIGSKSEVLQTDQICNAVNLPNVLSLAGKTTMDQLITLIKKATLMISNDTGPMHIAFSCQSPIICLFGPCSPDHYSTQLPNIRTIYKKVYCSPCVHEFIHPPCKGDNKCMQLISVDEVLEQVNQYLTHHHFLQDYESNVSKVVYNIDFHILGIVKR
ncbi:MAG: glycosyltransferase family 9 protein [Saprospiraceae bacterium]